MTLHPIPRAVCDHIGRQCISYGIFAFVVVFPSFDGNEGLTALRLITFVAGFFAGALCILVTKAEKQN